MIERSSSNGRVVVGSSIAKERIHTDGRVVGACGVSSERTSTVGRVVAAGGVAKERSRSDSRVEIARGIALERTNTDGRVSRAGGVKKERCLTVDRVETASGVAQKRRGASGRILVSGVAKERSSANGRVEIAVGEGFERQVTDCRIVCAGREIKKGAVPFRCVASGIASIRWRTYGLGHLRKRKAANQERNQKQSRPPNGAVNAVCGLSCHCHKQLMSGPVRFCEQKRARTIDTGNSPTPGP